ncbi:CRNN protein, partial [Penelope pileata]|nr:CRNN protein [Penelope pileata]
MAKLQENIYGIIATFYTYARRDGDCSALSRGELRQLIEQELADVIVDPRDPSTVEKVLCFLDEDRNGKVQFGEFLSLIFRVAHAGYKQLRCGAAADVQEPTVQEEKGREQPHRQLPGHGVSEQERGGTPGRAQDTQQKQKPEAPKNDKDTKKKQEGGTSKEDLDAHERDRTKAQEEGPKRGETVVTEISQQKNTQKAEKTPKHDPKPHHDQGTETPKPGSKHHQNPEPEPVEQKQTRPSKTPGTATSKTKDHGAPRQDPSPGDTQELLPPEQIASPHPDPIPCGQQNNPARLPKPTVVVYEGNPVAEAWSALEERQQGTGGKGQPVAKQQHLQPQWPLEK